MSDLELEKYEDKLLNIIENINYDEDLLHEAYKVIDRSSLEDLLRTTSKVKILESFAYEFLDVEGGDVHLPEEIAKNTYTPDKILDKLAQYGSYIGHEVAKNTSTSTETLLWICKYSNSSDMTHPAQAQLSDRQVILQDQGEIEEF